MQKSQRAIRVLLVDDEVGILQMFRRALSNYGFEIGETNDPLSAILMLKKQTFDIVVSDVHMPRVDGIEFVKMMREEKIDVPVILMTGRPSNELTLLATTTGALRCLVKPVMPMTLRAAIEQAVDARQT